MPRPRPSAPRCGGLLRAAVAAVVATVALAGCTGGPDPAPAPTADPTTAAATEVAVTSGDVTLTARAAGGDLRTGPGPDGATGLTLDLPAAAEAVVLTLVPPPGSSLEVLTDRSAVLRDGTGTAVAALDAPVLAGDAADAGWAARADAAAGGTATWSLSPPVGTGPAEPAGGTVTAALATVALREATWRDLDDEGGRSLAVAPTDAVRAGGLASEELLWAEIVAQEPDADAPGVRDQLTCHVVGAPDKATWNLEPWRPDVGLLATLAARCNPR